MQLAKVVMVVVVVVVVVVRARGSFHVVFRPPKFLGWLGVALGRAAVEKEAAAAAAAATLRYPLPTSLISSRHCLQEAG